GRDALTAALDNDDVIWIANNNGGHDRRPTQTANEIIGIVRGDRDPSPYARQMGVLLRDYIHGIYRGL
ncbi:MAG TPA: hypothetical protein VD735_00795, partial [Candidatus Saccharimonadales bacterium]|nr:hypothetical protein [Candidatus Saccharimonadales bacterium]